jgi:hypothetical protein
MYCVHMLLFELVEGETFTLVRSYCEGIYSLNLTLYVGPRRTTLAEPQGNSHHHLHVRENRYHRTMLHHKWISVTAE